MEWVVPLNVAGAGYACRHVLADTDSDPQVAWA